MSNERYGWEGPNGVLVDTKMHDVGHHRRDFADGNGDFAMSPQMSVVQDNVRDPVVDVDNEPVDVSHNVIVGADHLTCSTNLCGVRGDPVIRRSWSGQTIHPIRGHPQPETCSVVRPDVLVQRSTTLRARSGLMGGCRMICALTMSAGWLSRAR